MGIRTRLPEAALASVLLRAAWLAGYTVDVHGTPGSAALRNLLQVGWQTSILLIFSEREKGYSGKLITCLETGPQLQKQPGLVTFGVPHIPFTEGVGSRVCHPKCVFWDIGYFSKMKSQEKPFTLLLTAQQDVTEDPLQQGAVITGHVFTTNSMTDPGELASPFVQSSLRPCERWPSKHLLTKPLLFHLHVDCLSAL